MGRSVASAIMVKTVAHGGSIDTTKRLLNKAISSE